MLLTSKAAQNAARDVARKLATNRLSTDQASVTAKAELPAWVLSGATVSVKASALVSLKSGASWASQGGSWWSIG